MSKKLSLLLALTPLLVNAMEPAEPLPTRINGVYENLGGPDSLAVLCAKTIKTKTFAKLAANFDQKKIQDYTHWSLAKTADFLQKLCTQPHPTSIGQATIIGPKIIPTEIVQQYSLDPVHYMYTHNKQFESLLQHYINELLTTVTHSENPVITYATLIEQMPPALRAFLQKKLISTLDTFAWHSQIGKPTLVTKTINNGSPANPEAITELVMDSKNPQNVLMVSKSLAAAVDNHHLSYITPNDNEHKSTDYSMRSGDSIVALASSPHTNVVASMHPGQPTELKIFDAHNPMAFSVLRFSHGIQEVNFSPDGSLLAVNLHHELIKVIRTSDGSEIGSFKAPSIKLEEEIVPVCKFLFSNDNHYLVSCHVDGDAFLWHNASEEKGWDLDKSLTIAKVHPLLTPRIALAELTADNKYLCGVLDLNRTAVHFYPFNGNSKDKAYSFDNKSEICSVACHPHEQIVAFGSADGFITLFDIASQKPCNRFQFTTYDSSERRLPIMHAITSLLFSPDGKTLFAGTSKGELLSYAIHHSLDKNLFNYAVEANTNNENHLQTLMRSTSFAQLTKAEKERFYTFLHQSKKRKTA